MISIKLMMITSGCAATVASIAVRKAARATRGRAITLADMADDTVAFLAEVSS